MISPNHLCTFRSVFFVFFIFGSLQLSAQNTYKQDYGAWNSVLFDYNISEKNKLRAEFHLRTVSFLSENKKHFFRFSTNYRILPRVFLSFGYTYAKNYSRKKNKLRYLKEHDFWEQLYFNTTIQKLNIGARVRLEQRFKELDLASLYSAIKRYKDSNRVRFRLLFELPLLDNKLKIPLSTVFFDEVFLMMRPFGMPRDFDRNRAYLGIKAKLSPKITLSSGYQKNTIHLAKRSFLEYQIWNTFLIFVMKIQP